MNAKHRSETNEHFSPPWIVEAAREALEVIELDPASSVTANATVKAKVFFGLPKNALKERWFGRTFLNPPGGLVDGDGRPVIRANALLKREACTVTGDCGLAPGHEHGAVESSAVVWWRKLRAEWQQGSVESAVFLAFSIELLQTAQEEGAASPIDFPLCVPRARIAFLRERDGELTVGAQPTHASCLVYLPPRHDLRGERFSRAFSKFGAVRR
jgi:hypothetical protein